VLRGSVKTRFVVAEKLVAIGVQSCRFVEAEMIQVNPAGTANWKLKPAEAVAAEPRVGGVGLTASVATALVTEPARLVMTTE
jgi:hypothetical protein